MEPADMKERLKHAKKLSRTNPILTLDMVVLRPAIFFSTASQKPRALCNARPSANWK